MRTGWQKSAAVFFAIAIFNLSPVNGQGALFGRSAGKSAARSEARAASGAAARAEGRAATAPRSLTLRSDWEAASGTAPRISGSFNTQAGRMAQGQRAATLVPRSNSLLGSIPRGTAPPASAPVGRISGFGGKGFQTPQLKRAPFQPVRNAPVRVNGRQYSSHALDEMQNRGLTPRVVENVIATGRPFPTRSGTLGFFDKTNKLRVIVNSETGRVVTVIPGSP